MALCKCGNEPRAGKSALGNACLAALRRERRAAARPSPTRPTSDLSESDTRVSESDVATSEVGQPGAVIGDVGQMGGPDPEYDGPRHEQDLATLVKQIVGMRALAVGREQMITALTGEVSRLEEQLRARSQQESEAAFERTQEPRYARRPENMPAPKKGLGGQYTPHGSNCACIGCRASRVETRDGVGVAAE